MRNLICCGAMGLAVLVGGYHGLRYAEARRECCVGQAVVKVIGDRSGRACCSAEVCAPGGCLDGWSPPADMNRRSDDAAGEDSESSAPVASNRIIDLPGSSADAPAVIYIPQVNDPPSALPSGDAPPSEDQLATVPARTMPECVDEAASPTMPPVEGDPWPVKSAEAVRPAGWFEESEPADAAPMPACREDENLIRQYPGCPFPGDSAPSGKTRPERTLPWRHDDPPILPVPPEVSGVEKSGTSAESSHEDYSKPRIPWSTAGLLRHTSFKVWLNSGTERPARQKVDTLELRPGDVRHDETWLDQF